MIDQYFFKKLSELVEIYNQHIANNLTTDIPNIDQELDQIIRKIEHYVERYK